MCSTRSLSARTRSSASAAAPAPAGSRKRTSTSRAATSRPLTISRSGRPGPCIEAGTVKYTTPATPASTRAPNEGRRMTNLHLGEPVRTRGPQVCTRDARGRVASCGSAGRGIQGVSAGGCAPPAWQSQQKKSLTDKSAARSRDRAARLLAVGSHPRAQPLGECAKRECGISKKGVLFAQLRHFREQ